MEPRSPERLRAALRETAIRPEPIELPAKGMQGAVIGQFNKVFQQYYPDCKVDKATTDAARYLVWGWLLGEDSEPPAPLRSGDLTGSQWAALEDWVRVAKNEVINKWLPVANFSTEARWALNRARRDLNWNEARIAHGLPASTMAQLMTGYEPAPDLDEDGLGRAAIELGGVPAWESNIPMPATGWDPFDGAESEEIEPDIAVVHTSRLAGAALPDWV